MLVSVLAPFLPASPVEVLKHREHNKKTPWHFWAGDSSNKQYVNLIYRENNIYSYVCRIYFISATVYNEKIWRILKSTRQQPYQFHDVPCGSMPGILQYNQQVRTSAGTSMKRIDFYFKPLGNHLSLANHCYRFSALLLSVDTWICTDRACATRQIDGRALTTAALLPHNKQHRPAAGFSMRGTCSTSCKTLGCTVAFVTLQARGLCL